MAQVILFLRERSNSATDAEDGEDGIADVEDPYALLFARNGFTPIFVRVLTWQPVDAEVLRALWLKSAEYSGLIFTSKKAVQALGSAWEDLVRCDGARLHEWSRLPSFVVGKSTAEKVIDLGLSPVGEESGRAEELAKLIISVSGSGKPLLFLCGRTRLGILPKKLREANVNFEELCCYETAASPTIAEDLEAEVARVSFTDPGWMVFFSPAGAAAAMPVIASQLWWTTAKLASIGPTTSKYLSETGLRVDAEAENPTPNSLLDRIKNSLMHKEQANFK